MVELEQGEVWWADVPIPTGSEPGFHRPVVVMQANTLNRSRIGTAVCVPFTTNLRWSGAPGNVALAAKVTGLPHDSVANASQVFTADRKAFVRRVSKLPPKVVAQILSAIDVVLGR